MNRYDRQDRIENWCQDALSAARVMVLNAGAIGNKALKNMALMGVGHILVVDFDTIEPSNLSRTVLFADADIGKPKTAAAKAAMARLNPEIDVRTIDGDLFFDVSLGFFRSADMLIEAPVCKSASRTGRNLVRTRAAKPEPSTPFTIPGYTGIQKLYKTGLRLGATRFRCWRSNCSFRDPSS